MPALAAGLVASAAALSGAQPSSNSPLVPPPNGMRSAEPDRWAIVNATVHPRPGESIEARTVLIADGVIEGVVAADGADVVGYRVFDAQGMHVYAAFIDAGIEVDTPMPDADEPGRHWIPSVTPRRRALDGVGLVEKERERLRGLGFGAAAIAPEDGIFRGVGAVVSTAKNPEDPSAGTAPVYSDGVFHSVGFDRDRSSSVRAYPGSVMGAVSIVRQVFSDAAWQQAIGGEPNAISPLNFPFPVVFDCESEMMVLLSDGIAREFGKSAIFRGSGTEYKRLDAIAATGYPVIVPLRFPSKPDLTMPGAVDAVDLATLMEWEQAPTNARRLADAGLPVAITSANLPKGAKFDDNMRRAIDEGGLTPDAALAMVTTTPASILGVEDILGTVETGKIASVLVTSGPVFEEDTERRAIWIDGVRHDLEDADDFPLDGAWTIHFGADATNMGLTFNEGKITYTEGDEKTKARGASVDAGSFHALVDQTDDGETGTYILSGTLASSGTIVGTGVDPQGNAFQFTAERNADAADSDDEDDKDDQEDKKTDPAPEDLGGYPFGAYSVAEIPSANPVLFTNATVWTSGPAGVIENGFVLIADGEIDSVGSMGDVPSVPSTITTIDCDGAHITPGLIDAHSHTGLFRFGVNEAGQAVTAEVRIHDSLDPGDVNFYRQLAGGITAVNSLHGSANPIGGQNAVHKNRWGSRHPDDMLLEGIPSGIKFALGENVKQSNWGDKYTTRYPQTRMGVETMIRDRFTAARAYAAERDSAGERGQELAELQGEIQAMQQDIGSRYPPAAINWAFLPEYQRDANWDALQATGQVNGVDRAALLRDIAGARALFNRASRVQKNLLQRRDLELEALAEILAGDRLIHCHSYRQDEILMLCRVAEDFGFKIGTFQHGLEVYKVAETVREHAIGASIFSDWWAYKVEVQDAIPYAGPIQHEVGVLTSFNSDDNELARRMNLEAAKAVKYSGGRVTPEEALKFVTINPAIQLGAQAMIGSLEPGKHADLVVWSGDPLSTYSRTLRTYVDGRELFSEAIDAAHRERIASERVRLIRKIVAAPDRAEDKADEADPDAEPDEGEDPERRRSLLARVQLDAHDAELRNQQGVCGCGWFGAGIDLE
ncbi:MAG: hypothetical protein DHS20C14_14950 [Phycisphaeraceae bacterium]|nr:MAG: hypothetical protein DHS20C14_14950 [Phycisphaeraceae bacterium]